MAVWLARWQKRREQFRASKHTSRMGQEYLTHTIVYMTGAYGMNESSEEFPIFVNSIVMGSMVSLAIGAFYFAQNFSQPLVMALSIPILFVWLWISPVNQGIEGKNIWRACAPLVFNRFLFLNGLASAIFLTLNMLLGSYDLLLVFLALVSIVSLSSYVLWYWVK